MEEIKSIYNNLEGIKKLRIYEEAGHENYLVKYKTEWTEDVKEFLEQTHKKEIKDYQ